MDEVGLELEGVGIGLQMWLQDLVLEAMVPTHQTPRGPSQVGNATLMRQPEQHYPMKMQKWAARNRTPHNSSWGIWRNIPESR